MLSKAASSARCHRGADAYVLSSILHDWPDEAAARMLRARRAAMRPDANLFVIEQLLGEPNSDPEFFTESDVAMMVLLGGKERPRNGFAKLLATADLRLADVIHTYTSFSEPIARCE